MRVLTDGYMCVQSEFLLLVLWEMKKIEEAVSKRLGLH